MGGIPDTRNSRGTLERAPTGRADTRFERGKPPRPPRPESGWRRNLRSPHGFWTFALAVAVLAGLGLVFFVVSIIGFLPVIFLAISLTWVLIGHATKLEGELPTEKIKAQLADIVQHLGERFVKPECPNCGTSVFAVEHAEYGAGKFGEGIIPAKECTQCGADLTEPVDD